MNFWRRKGVTKCSGCLGSLIRRIGWTCLDSRHYSPSIFFANDSLCMIIELAVAAAEKCWELDFLDSDQAPPTCAVVYVA